MRRAWRCALFAGLCVLAGQGWSHDSWLSPSRLPSPHNSLRLELATGSHYPLQEFSQSPQSVARAACRGRDNIWNLTPVAQQEKWLDLAAEFPAQTSPLSCWLELSEVEAEIDPRLVQVYFTDIRATFATRETWAAQQARNMPWLERYRKFARIELPAQEATPAQIAAARQPVGLGLEIVVVGDQPIAVGQPLTFQVLRDGRPLEGLSVQLVSERSPLGVWAQSDAQGQLRHSLPFGGHWLLRATDLRPSAERPDSWESRFVTLAIEAR